MIQSIVMLLVALTVIGLSIGILIKIQKVRKSGIEADGIIFDLENTVSSDSTVSYPIVRFITEDNQWITQKATISAIPLIYKKGKKVTVIYQKEYPSNFYIKDTFTYLIPLLVLFIGVIIAVFGTVALINI